VSARVTPSLAPAIATGRTRERATRDHLRITIALLALVPTLWLAWLVILRAPLPLADVRSAALATTVFCLGVIGIVLYRPAAAAALVPGVVPRRDIPVHVQPADPVPVLWRFVSSRRWNAQTLAFGLIAMSEMLMWIRNSSSLEARALSRGWLIVYVVPFLLAVRRRSYAPARAAYPAAERGVRT
jgi:hypothetical protein